MKIEEYLKEHTIVKIGIPFIPEYICSEIIVNNPKELVPIVRESGCYISEIRWWHLTEISSGSSIGYGGPRDPRRYDTHYYAETDICREFDAPLQDEEYYEYFDRIKHSFSEFDLYPAFDIKKQAR